MEKEKEIEGESSDIEQKISKPKENMVKNQRKNKKHNKKTKHKKEMEDISDQIQFQLKYENFEEDSDVFQLQLTRKESKIKMDDSSLLDQSHFRFMIKDNSEIMKKYNHIKQHNFKNTINLKLSPPKIGGSIFLYLTNSYLIYYEIGIAMRFYV